MFEAEKNVLRFSDIAIDDYILSNVEIDDKGNYLRTL